MLTCHNSRNQEIFMLNEIQCWEMGKSQDEWGNKGMDIIPRKTSTEIGKKTETLVGSHCHGEAKKSITVKYGNNNALRLVTLKKHEINWPGDFKKNNPTQTSTPPKKKEKIKNIHPPAHNRTQTKTKKQNKQTKQQHKDNFFHITEPNNQQGYQLKNKLNNKAIKRDRENSKIINFKKIKNII